MASNTGEGYRNGAIKGKTQFQTPSGHWAKRDSETGRISDIKTTDKSPFKGVRKEK